MAEIEAVAKDRKNEQQGFKFRGIDDVYNELHARLAKHCVFTVPMIMGRYRETLEKKSIYQGQEKITRGTLVVTNFRFRFYADDGSYVDADADGEAIDWGGDKASNKAASIAHKYALLQVFCIPTEDEKDPDTNWNEVTAVMPMPRNPNGKASPLNNSAPVVAKPIPAPKNAFTGVSDEQRKLVYAVAKQAGLEGDVCKAEWQRITGKESSKEWTREDFEKVLSAMKAISVK